MNSTVKVGLVQHTCTEDRDKNFAISLAGIREAASRGARLILLQELHTGVYFCQAEDTKRFDLAETAFRRAIWFLMSGGNMISCWD